MREGGRKRPGCFKRVSLTDPFPNLPCFWSIPTSESVRPVSLPWLGRGGGYRVFPNSQRVRRNPNTPHCMPFGDWVNCIVRGGRFRRSHCRCLVIQRTEVRATRPGLSGLMVVEGQSDLLKLLKDPSSRVVSLSAIALGRVAPKGDDEAVNALFAVAQRNQGKTLRLRSVIPCFRLWTGLPEMPNFRLFQIRGSRTAPSVRFAQRRGQAPNLPSSLRTKTKPCANEAFLPFTIPRPWTAPPAKL